MNDDLTITIRCLAYNHRPYIRQCLEGIIMQRTNFRYEAIVHDDASTDGTADIIREYAEKYPDIIKPIFETENQYSKHDGSLQRIMNENTHGKYVAFCEGDDYWTDPLKLQKQVDFLETHPDYTYSCHRYNIYDEQTKELKISSNKYFEKFPKETEFTFDLKYVFYKEWVSKTLTCVYRKDALDPSVINKYKFFRDVHMVYYILSNGKGVCHSFVGGVYRRNPYSTYNSLSEIRKINVSQIVYNELYQVTHDPLIRKKIILLFTSKIILNRRLLCPHNKLECLGLLILPFNLIKRLL